MVFKLGVADGSLVNGQLLAKGSDFEEKSAFETAEEEQVQDQENERFPSLEPYRGFAKRQLVSAWMSFQGARVRRNRLTP